MPLNVKLDKKYSIQGDEKQWLLVKFDGTRDRNSGYYNNLAVLLSDYIKIRGRTSECKTIEELTSFLKLLQNSLKQALPLYKMAIKKEVCD